MLIRSQQKYLLIPHGPVFIEKRTTNGPMQFLIKIMYHEEEFSVGIYSTEEKTLKVLDMIEERYVLSGMRNNGFAIFYMPQDEEVQA